MTPSNIHVAPFQSSKGISKARKLSVPDGGNIHGGWMVKELLANIALNGISRKLPNPAVSDQESHGGDRFSFLKSGCNPSNRQSFTSRT
jgi:hypothetical protein